MFLQVSVILPMGAIHTPLQPHMYASQPCMTPTVWVASGQYASYWNAVLFKLGLNDKMYSCVVHFLNYFVFISERNIRTERREVEGVGKLKWQS